MDEVIYRLLKEATVFIEIDDGSIFGTGTLVAPHTVLSVAHLFEEENIDRIVVIWQNRAYDARVLSKWTDLDILLLQVASLPIDHQCVYLHRSIRPGDSLYSFGYSSHENGDSSLFKCEGLSFRSNALIKFSQGEVPNGFGGSPLLNQRTGGVCGIINRSRDFYGPAGGFAIPVESIFSVFPFLEKQQREYHKSNNHWLRLLETVNELDKPLKIENILIPTGYQKLLEPIEAFFQDTANHCDVYSKNVFIMTRYQPGNKTLETIDKTLRDTLRSHGLFAHRADDRCYATDRNLWDNLCTYMIGCKYGIAVLENIILDEFNPNVALEYGFMRALGKPTLLLKEKRMAPRADILGTIWEEFDMLEIEDTIKRAVERWINDFDI